MADFRGKIKGQFSPLFSCYDFRNFYLYPKTHKGGLGRNFISRLKALLVR